MTTPVPPAVVLRHGKRWIPVATAASTLGVSKERIYHLIWQARVQSLKLRALLYVLETDVTAYAAYQKARSQGSRMPRSPRRLTTDEGV